jgi:hypothetical protein
MADRTEAETVLLNKLVSDCITFGLKQNEALKYIEIEFGQPINPRSYRRRKTKLQSENQSNLWLNYFTRIGFVQNHQKLFEDIRKLYDEALKTYFTETIRPKEERNQDLILRLKADIRENAKLLAEFNLSTPVISAIKQKLQEKKKDNGLQVIPSSH